MFMRSLPAVGSNRYSSGQISQTGVSFIWKF